MRLPQLTRPLLHFGHGTWYRVLDRQDREYSNGKNTAGGKCDYHTLGACWEVSELQRRASVPGAI